MQKIALFVNRDRDADLSATKEVVSILKKFNCRCNLPIKREFFKHAKSIANNIHAIFIKTKNLILF